MYTHIEAGLAKACLPLLVDGNYFLYRKFYVVHIPTYREVLHGVINDHLAHRGVECGQPYYSPSDSTSIYSHVHLRGVYPHSGDVSYSHTWMYVFFG